VQAHKQVSASEVLEHYELLSSLTARMHEAATRGEWDLVSSIEQQRSTLISALKLLDADPVLDEAESARKRQLIEKILADDTAIRTLTEQRIDELRGSMKSGHQAQRLRKTYKD